MPKRLPYRVAGAVATTLSILIALLITQTRAQRSVTVRVNRWLSVKQISGNVQHLRGNRARQAQVGDQIFSVRDGLRTGTNASSMLEVDTGIGTISLRENTEIRIQKLDFAPDNGRITHLQVSRGQVNLNLRRFTHGGSELELETPSAVNAVRGTEFGVIVHGDGTTGVATLSGQVDTMAQSIEVEVPGGFQTLVRPGFPPLPPTPIPEEPDFEYRVEGIIRGNQRIALLVGRIDPINQVYVNGVLQTLKPWGEFSYEAPARRGSRVTVMIVTPLGDEVEYDISLL